MPDSFPNNASDNNDVKMVSIMLDGDTVSVPAGSTIWEAAQGQGNIIPHLCHKPEPGLSV
jgi:formate dehydrogenase major subunit